jgi:hypothetical protein
MLTKTLPWYKVPPRVPRFTIRVGDDIDLGPFRSAPPPRASRQLNDWLVRAYEHELAPLRGYNGPRDAPEIHESDPGEPAGAHADER